MKSLLLGAALALACITPAAATNLGCWDTTTVKTNSSPAGSWKITATSTVDYMQSNNEGVTALLTSLPAFASGGFAICFEGSKTTSGTKKVWKLDTAMICTYDHIANSVCS